MITNEKITFDKAFRWTITALLIGAIIYIVNYLGSVLLPFFIAWLFAYLLYPAVKFFQYKVHIPGRALSIIVTLIVVIAILTGIVWLIIPPMIEQFEKLGVLATNYIKEIAHIHKRTPGWPTRMFTAAKQNPAPGSLNKNRHRLTSQQSLAQACTEPEQQLHGISG